MCSDCTNILTRTICVRKHKSRPLPLTMFTLIGINNDAYAWVLFIAECCLAGTRALASKETPQKRAAPEEVENNSEDKEDKSKKARHIFDVRHTRFIVETRLNMQPLFDDKIHKNDHLWDRITQKFH